MKKKHFTLDLKLALPSIALVLTVSLIFALIGDTNKSLLQQLLNFISWNFGGFYEVYVFILLVILAVFALSPIGKIRLGDCKPKYSTPSWISMLFCACMGSSLMYWGLIEWSYYLKQTPFGIAPMSQEANEWSVSYMMFHWGLSGWGTYCIAAIIIAYHFFVRKKTLFRISVSCNQYKNGKSTKGGQLIDIFVILGLCAGVAVSVAIGTPLVAAGINELFGIQPSNAEYILIIAVWAALFGGCAFAGMDKGVKVLSNINSIIGIVFILFVLFCGSTGFIINNVVNSFGIMAQNYLRMSFYTDPSQINHFPQDWTIFYWAWWIAYVPVMGLFIAKISEGRSIRQVALGTTVFGSMGCWFYMGILGSYGLNLQTTGKLDIVGLIADQGGNAAIMAILKTLPLPHLVIAVFVVLSFIFLATTCDSSAYMLASITTKKLTVADEPAPANRVLWSVVIVVWPTILILIGGLDAVRLSSVIGSIPLLVIIAVMIKNFIKDVGTYPAKKDGDSGLPLKKEGSEKDE